MTKGNTDFALWLEDTGHTLGTTPISTWSRPENNLYQKKVLVQSKQIFNNYSLKAKWILVIIVHSKYFPVSDWSNTFKYRAKLVRAFAFQPVRHESGIFHLECIKACLHHDLSCHVESVQLITWNRNWQSNSPPPMSSDQMPRPQED